MLNIISSLAAVNLHYCKFHQISILFFIGKPKNLHKFLVFIFIWFYCCNYHLTSLSPARSFVGHFITVCDKKHFVVNSVKYCELHYAYSFTHLSPTVPSTSCCALCKSHLSFEVPAIASFWPDTDLNTPVHLSLTLYVPPSPSPTLIFMSEPCLSHPRLLPDRQQTGPDRWPSSVTGSPQRALPVSTHFLLSAPLTWTPLL